ncbi:hypothetical protein [Desertifilum sp. FACHB-868]|nr:hypothetical protein [Desertifilum sp. FACHB-868]
MLKSWKKVVGWVSASVTQQQPEFCWVSYLNPTYVTILIVSQAEEKHKFIEINWQKINA